MAGKDWTLVTGASEGIGKELARICAKNGRNVILVARSVAKLEALAEELSKAHSVETHVIGADLSQSDAAAEVWEQATRDRKVDFLINNAGLGRHGDFANGDWDRELTSMQVNMHALTDLMKRAVAYFSDTKSGRILNVASIAAYTPGPNMAVYHATKAYVLSLSLAVNEELSGRNVSITALCPGATQSNFFNEADMHGVRLVKASNLPTAREVAELGYAAAIGRRPVAIHGFMNKALVFLTRFIPSAWSAKITKTVMGKV